MSRKENTRKISTVFNPEGLRSKNGMPVNGGSILDKDPSSFPELLGNWMTQEGCHSAEAFLNKIGLTGAIEPEQLKAVMGGKQTPGPKLATLLSMALPGQLLRPGERRLHKLGLYKLRNSAAWFRKNHGALPVIEIPEEKFEAYSLRILDRIAATASPAVPGTEESEIKNSSFSLNDKIYDALEPWAKKAGCDMEELIEMLTEVYTDDPLPAIHHTRAMLAGNGLTVTDDEAEQFLTSLGMKNLPAPAQALRFLRQSQGLSQGELLPDKNGKKSIRAWEIGRRSITASKLGDLIESLEHSQKVSIRFAGMVRPELIDKTGSDWLAKAYDEGSWDQFSHPSFNKTWRAAHPIEKRPGLLLGDYRKRRGLSRPEMVDLLEIPLCEDTLFMLEMGKYPIKPQRLDEFICFFKLSENEADDFTKEVRSQSAQMLTLFREERGLSQQELAGEIGVDELLIYFWESAKRPIDPDKLGDLFACLKISGRRARSAPLFASLVRPELFDHTGEEWFKKQFKTKNWENLRLPALDSEWLSAQPALNQAGLILRDFRKRCHLSIEGLAAMIKVDPSIISDWEGAEYPINLDKFGDLKKRLYLSPSETDDFEKAINNSSLAFQRRDEELWQTNYENEFIKAAAKNQFITNTDVITFIWNVKKEVEKAPEKLGAVPAMYQSFAQEMQDLEEEYNFLQKKWEADGKPMPEPRTDKKLQVSLFEEAQRSAQGLYEVWRNKSWDRSIKPVEATR